MALILDTFKIYVNRSTDWAKVVVSDNVVHEGHEDDTYEWVIDMLGVEVIYE